MLTVLLTALERTERLGLLWSTGDEQPRPELLPGDVLCGSTGRSSHHLALYMGQNRLVHCWAGFVREGNVHDTMLVKHLRCIWRAYA
jgi:cell wall-associated NlpC family hydrolase